MRQIIVRAEMRDGTIIEEAAHSFFAFTGLVLGFRKDADVRRIVWEETDDPPDPLAPLAGRLVGARGYLAHTLARTDPALVRAALWCDRAALSRVAVCRVPREETWEDDVATIAGYAGIDQGRLDGVLRRVMGGAE